MLIYPLTLKQLRDHGVIKKYAPTAIHDNTQTPKIEIPIMAKIILSCLYLIKFYL